MDLGSIIGIVAAFVVVLIAIMLGGNLTQFIDDPSILIVIGGGFAATLVRVPLAGIGGAFVVGGKVAFTHM